MDTLLTVFALGVWLGAAVVWGWYYFGSSAGEPKGAPETPAPVPVAVAAQAPVVIQKPSVMERVIERVLPAPPPIVVEKVIERVVEAPRGVKAPERWKAVFVSGSGRRILGREVYTQRRTPQMSYVGMDGLKGTFVLTGKKDDGSWEYRRVGVERS